MDNQTSRGLLAETSDINGNDYGRAVMDRNAAETLAREAYAAGDMALRDEMLVEYRAAKERVKNLEPRNG